jgi:hypothetical protein
MERIGMLLHILRLYWRIAILLYLLVVVACLATIGYVFYYYKNSSSRVDFEVSYEGVINGKFEGKGYFPYCGGPPDYPVVLLSPRSDPHSSITLALPADASPGTFPFSNSGNAERVYTVSGVLHADDTSYAFYPFDVKSGSITLTTLPDGFGQGLRGHFEVSVRTIRMRGNANGTINIRGSFDLEPSGFDCYR